MKRAGPPGALSGVVAAMLVLTALVGVFALRLWLLREVSTLLDCQDCLLVQVWPHELQFAFVLLALHWASVSVPAGPVMAIALRAAIAMAWAVSLIDLTVMATLYARPHWTDVVRFGGQWQAGLSLLAGREPWVAGAAVVAGPVLWAWWRYVTGTGANPGWPVRRSGGAHCRSERLHRYGAGLVLITVILSLEMAKEDNFHAQHVMAAPLHFFALRTHNRDYGPGPGPVDAIDVADEALACRAGGGQRLPVVLVILESFSNDMSRLWGGARDWTPQLDRWAAAGRRYTRFLANGVTTEDGLVALLMGLPPLPGPGRRPIFEQYADAPATLPRELIAAGYDVHFMTTGNLAFVDKGRWLRAIGFPQPEGHDHPHYLGWPRFHFDAAPDEALYGRARAWLRDRMAAPD